MKNSNMDKVSELLKSAEQGNHYCYIELARIYSKQFLQLGYTIYGKYPHKYAIQYIDKSIELLPDEPEPYFLKGLTLYSGKNVEAIKYFKKWRELGGEAEYNNHTIKLVSMFIDDLERNHTAKEKNTGCYLATMAYGDYNHPQVIKLRLFRDKKLINNRLGYALVILYYRLSPKLVSKLKNKSILNLIIRKFLDISIRIIEYKCKEVRKI